MNVTLGATRPVFFGAASAGAGKKGSLFSPGGTPAQLWMREPTKRKIDLSGLFSPEDTLIAIARGMHPGVLIDLDHRATIRGGLTVLKMSGIKGYTKVPVNVLKSTLANLPEHDDQLRRYAKGGNNLKSSANYIRKLVHKHKLDQAAWGARQLYILDNIKGFTVGRALAAVAMPFALPGWGFLISAGLGVQGAISGAIAKKVAEDATGNMRIGLSKVKLKSQAQKVKAGAEAQGKTVSGNTPTRSFSPSASSSIASKTESEGAEALVLGAPMKAWYVGGAVALVLVGGAVFLRKQQQKPATARGSR